MYAQFDAKLLYLLNTFLFEAGSAICGAAPSMDALIVGRAICGLGGSGMYTGVLTLLSVTTTDHERPTYIGFTGLTWGLGTVLGPIIGGGFADSSATWRWAFCKGITCSPCSGPDVIADINLCVGGAFAPVWIFLLPRFDPRPGVTLRRRFAELDYLGTLLMIGAFVSGVMAISFGGNVYSWNSGRIIGLFVCSGVLFILFGVQQSFSILTTEERRIFPIQFVKSKIMLILFAETSAASTACFIPIYFIPLLFQFVRSDSALEAGVRLMPYVVFLVFMCVANGAVMSATGYYFPWYLGSGIFTVIGSALMYTVDDMSSTARIYGYSILLGLGSGGFVQASFSVAQAKVAPEMIPVAIGFITAAQLGGASIALAIANSVFLSQSRSAIAALLPNVPTAQIQAAISGAGSDLLKSLTEDMREKVLHAIVHAMSKVYIMVGLFRAFFPLPHIIFKFTKTRRKIILVKRHALQLYDWTMIVILTKTSLIGPCRRNPCHSVVATHETWGEVVHEGGRCRVMAPCQVLPNYL